MTRILDITNATHDDFNQKMMMIKLKYLFLALVLILLRNNKIA